MCPRRCCRPVLSRLGSAVGLTAALLPAPGLADAADAQDALPEVASAPRRMEIPVERVAGSITVITREEIERRQWRTLVDVLKFVPGVNVVQNGGPGKKTSIFTRGTNSNHTKVLLDGIDISDPSTPTGAVDLAHLLTENLERIEVMRGPMSTLYGSEAVGGIINLVTRRGHGKPGIAVWGEAGGYNSAQQETSLYGSHRFGDRKADWSIGYSTLHTGGFHVLADDSSGQERDGYDNSTLSGRLTFEPTETLELNFVGRYIDTENEIDLSGDSPDDISDTQQVFLRSQASREFWNGNWKSRLGLSYTDHHRETKGVFHGSFDGSRLAVDWLNDFYIGDHHVVTLGAETKRDSIDSSSPSSGFGADARSSAALIQEQFSYGNWFGTASGRLQDHEDFGSALTYRAASGYVHPQFGTRVHASIGTSFKAPSLDQLYGAYPDPVFPFFGNPDLEPEKSQGLEFGIEQPFWGDRIRAGVTYFQNRIRSLIQFKFQPLPDSSTLENIARAETKGFESFVLLQLSDRFYARADWTYLSAKDEENGQDLMLRPKNTFDVRVEGRPLRDATVTLGVRYVGAREDRGDVTLSGYTIVDLAGNYQLNRYFKLFARIDNLFDREYQDPDGYEQEGFNCFAGLRGAY